MWLQYFQKSSTVLKSQSLWKLAFHDPSLFSRCSHRLQFDWSACGAPAAAATSTFASFPSAAREAMITCRGEEDRMRGEGGLAVDVVGR